MCSRGDAPAAPQRASAGDTAASTGRRSIEALQPDLTLQAEDVQSKLDKDHTLKQEQLDQRYVFFPPNLYDFEAPEAVLL